MRSINAHRLLHKLKYDQLRMYNNPNQGPNFVKEVVHGNYLVYKKFLKTGIFNRIVCKHTVKRSVVLSKISTVKKKELKPVIENE